MSSLEKLNLFVSKKCKTPAGLLRVLTKLDVLKLSCCYRTLSCAKSSKGSLVLNTCLWMFVYI